MSNPILELKQITKVYPGVTALKELSLAFHAGEVHAIAGENGAGKSTFIKCITGAVTPTSGSIWFDGKVLVGNTPARSLAQGIAAIYQEFQLIPNLTVAENIYFGRQPKHLGFVDFKAMQKGAAETLNTLGVKIDPKSLVRDLSVGFQQMVEIAKAISRHVRVLIMDEPSAPLTNNEIDYLFAIVRRLKSEGCCILYISHRLEEIFELCDVVTVFRDGEKIETKRVAETSQAELISLMVNRKLEETFPVRLTKPGEEALRVEGLCASRVKDANFVLRKGEILGLAGLVGAGRTELASAIIGLNPKTAGVVKLHGAVKAIRSPGESFRQGIALIPEDRKRYGALLKLSIRENITYSNLQKASNKLRWIRKRAERETANHYRDVLSIRTPSIEQRVSNLSGGNQQKVVMARCLYTDADILIFDEPTRGIDVGAKQEIYQLINRLTAEGKAILLISSEMPELLGLSDRILVLHEGKIVGEMNSADASQERILTLASGL